MKNRIFMLVAAFTLAIVGAFASNLNSSVFTLKGDDGMCSNATNLVGGEDCEIRSSGTFCTVTIDGTAGYDAYDVSCIATNTIKKP